MEKTKKSDKGCCGGRIEYLMRYGFFLSLQDEEAECDPDSGVDDVSQIASHSKRWDNINGPSSKHGLILLSKVIGPN